jgi:uncharacterized membrane protein
MNDYFRILIILLLVDVIWLFSQKDYYNNLISNVQGSKLNIRKIPAVLIYFVLAFAIYTFVIKSGDINKPNDVIKNGALLGFIIYSVYDLTNYATLDKWTLHMTVMDILWGTALCGITTALFIKYREEGVYTN